MSLPFFVYGTLRPGEGNYSWCLQGKTRKEVPGTLAGAQMYGRMGFPYVILSPEQEDTIQGDLVWIDEDVVSYQDAQNSLDGLEGTRFPGRNMGNHYDRLIADVQTEEGVYKAWVYIANMGISQALIEQSERNIPPRIVDGDWIRHVRDQNRYRLTQMTTAT